MGAKAALLSFAGKPPRFDLLGYPRSDAEQARALVEASYPGKLIVGETETDLDEAIWPPVGTACAGVFGDVAVLTGRDLSHGRPSDLTPLVTVLAPTAQAYAVLMESTVDWYEFAVWDRSRLTRSFSASAGDGVIEDVGEPLPFEWPEATPIERANEALRAYWGFVQEGRWERDGLDPEELRLSKFIFADTRARQDALRELTDELFQVQPD
ncbi:DUF6928 family protein [Actinoplanes xinjiangensis]|uniref:DUF6928 family protein n=1 Tax=Actinoplanes xinjiangensis TaxID=512350 RepID=UPI00343A2553